jgi:hypothetical protein
MWDDDGLVNNANTVTVRKGENPLSDLRALKQSTGVREVPRRYATGRAGVIRENHSDGTQIRLNEL